jgi:hypothetical protein
LPTQSTRIPTHNSGHRLILTNNSTIRLPSDGTVREFLLASLFYILYIWSTFAVTTTWTARTQTPTHSVTISAGSPLQRRTLSLLPIVSLSVPVAQYNAAPPLSSSHKFPLLRLPQLLLAAEAAVSPDTRVHNAVSCYCSTWFCEAVELI